MNVLVTGGHGFIGSVVVRKLLAEGHRVRCCVRPGAATERIAGLDVELCHGDVRDALAVRHALAGQNAVIHMAGPSSWDVINSPEAALTVVGGMRNVLDAASSQGKCRVVYISSVAAIGYGSPCQVVDEATPYCLDKIKALRHSHQKHEAEQLCRQASAGGADVVIVNPAEVYGPNDTKLVTAGNLLDFAHSKPILVCRGGTSVIHVEDVAAGIVAALFHGQPGQRYILGGENLTIRQLAESVVSILGLRTPVITVPNLAMTLAASASTLFGMPIPFNPHVLPYATRYWFVDSSKARRELGVTFRSARETLDSTLSWLRATGRIR